MHVLKVCWAEQAVGWRSCEVHQACWRRNVLLVQLVAPLYGLVNAKMPYWTLFISNVGWTSLNIAAFPSDRCYQRSRKLGGHLDRTKFIRGPCANYVHSAPRLFNAHGVSGREVLGLRTWRTRSWGAGANWRRSSRQWIWRISLSNTIVTCLRAVKVI